MSSPKCKVVIDSLCCFRCTKAIVLMRVTLIYYDFVKAVLFYFVQMLQSQLWDSAYRKKLAVWLFPLWYKAGLFILRCGGRHLPIVRLLTVTLFMSKKSNTPGTYELIAQEDSFSFFISSIHSIISDVTSGGPVTLLLGSK